MSVTVIIIIITVGISLVAFNNGDFFQKSLMNPFMVFRKNQYWRLISSGFTHGSYVHLGFNMFTFYFFGRVVEMVFAQVLGDSGVVWFILFYLSAIIISDLPTAFKQKDNLNYNSLGASGAVSAMVFASIIYFPLNDICLYGFICIPGFLLGVGYVVYSYFRGRTMSDNINHEAHLYGAIYGIVVAISVHPASAIDFFHKISTWKIFG